MANGAIYVGSWGDEGFSSSMYALDLFTGAVLWSFPLTGFPFWSPTVANGVVYVGTLDTDHMVNALDASTGAVLWSFRTGWTVWSSPAVADGVVYVASLDDNVYAFGL